ncbi:MAG: hypothetical protein ACHRHE_23565, partial [Tepidisphaerales bacterium]
MCKVVLTLVAAMIACVPGPGAKAGEAGGGVFEVKGVKIHYLVEGKGDAVVLIHGLYSSAAINWKMPGIVAALAKD